MKRISGSIALAGAALLLGCGSSVRHERGAAGGRAGQGTGGSGEIGGTGGGGSGGTGGTGGSSRSVGEFCPMWLDEFASFMQRCSCDEAAVRRFRDVNAALCEPDGFLGRLVAAVDSGDLVYNPGAADALLARLRDADAPCVDEPYRALKLDSVEVHSFAGTFIGTPRLGNTCTMPIGEKGGVSDCREGFCLPDPEFTGFCGNLVQEGQPCDLDPVPGRMANVCHETTPPDVDGEYARAFRSLVCVPSSSGGGICARGREDGAACAESETCASGRCVGNVCGPKSSMGEPCEVHFDCEAGACGLERVCVAPLSDGESCQYDDAACSSGYCNDVAGADVCASPPTQAVGDACTTSAECVSIGSGSSRDRACQAGSCVNDICAEYSQ